MRELETPFHIGTSGRWFDQRPFVFPLQLVCAFPLLNAAQPSVLGASPTVAMIRSDDTSLPDPVARTQRLDYHRHVFPMVQSVLKQANLRDLLTTAGSGEDVVVDVVQGQHRPR